jgi:hypothetical protein
LIPVEDMARYAIMTHLGADYYAKMAYLRLILET